MVEGTQKKRKGGSGGVGEGDAEEGGGGSGGVGGGDAEKEREEEAGELVEATQMKRERRKRVSWWWRRGVQYMAVEALWV